MFTGILYEVKKNALCGGLSVRGIVLAAETLCSFVLILYVVIKE